jgi:hypothetical protein
MQASGYTMHAISRFFSQQIGQEGKVNPSTSAQAKHWKSHISNVTSSMMKLVGGGAVLMTATSLAVRNARRGASSAVMKFWRRLRGQANSVADAPVLRAGAAAQRRAQTASTGRRRTASTSVRFSKHRQLAHFALQ